MWWADFGPWVPDWDPTTSEGMDAKAAANAGLRPGGDLFLDGSIGSHTAAVDPPYIDSSGVGELFYDDETVGAFFSACTEIGGGAGGHAIGERAIGQAARALEFAAAEHGADAVRAARHRIEHVELPRQADLATFGRLGVTASVQPVFDALWGGTHQLYAGRFGKERACGSNPFDAMDHACIPLAFGSDSTVTPMGPVEAMHAAVNHLGGHGVPALRALRAHSVGARYIAGQDEIGQLIRGARADLAVWERDPVPRQGTQSEEVSCLATMVRGMLVHGAW